MRLVQLLHLNKNLRTAINLLHEHRSHLIDTQEKRLSLAQTFDKTKHTANSLHNAAIEEIKIHLWSATLVKSKEQAIQKLNEALEVSEQLHTSFIQDYAKVQRVMSRTNEGSLWKLQ
ncbi:hypothetical protein BIY22_16020 [Vibrio panuliri]|uniref:Uncharacterized protein n=1 Tax=Vibrio panuliri TaxID=1381081 RepID=A0A1Q9HNC0_9VIBR|nr:hypothetical protein [Vibrio panuliri]OLQ92319.1 hypothetical protein BIY22_16020 [Vibrio panuliri]